MASVLSSTLKVENTLKLRDGGKEREREEEGWGEENKEKEKECVKSKILKLFAGRKYSKNLRGLQFQ